MHYTVANLGFEIIEKQFSMQLNLLNYIKIQSSLYLNWYRLVNSLKFQS